MERLLFYVQNNWKEVFYKVIVFFASSLFFSNIPVLLFLFYMMDYSFFSYDFFSDGVFAISVFYITIIAMILSFSGLCFGSIILFIGKFKYKKDYKWRFIIISVIFNMVLSLFFGCLIYKTSLFLLLLMFLISLAVIMHISILMYEKASKQLMSLIILVSVIFIIILNMRQETNLLLAKVLSKFGVGGDIQVQLISKSEPDMVLNGRLKLVTPDNIYLILDEKKGITTISRSKFDYFTVTK